MARYIRTYPDPVLKTTAKPVEAINQDVKDLAQEMADLMYANQGIGLAAPQVGEAMCVIAVDVSGPERREDLQILINPVIESVLGETETEEGCLSLPEFRSKVQRAEQVTLTGLDLNGQEVRIESEGLQAICFQHEIDHLNGKLLLDHAGRLKRNLYCKKANKWEKKN